MTRDPARKDIRATPWGLFHELESKYGARTLDVCASPHNAKCANYYALEEGHSGLEEPWFGRVWCNPPFSNIEPWIEHAWGAMSHPFGPEDVVCIVPAWTDRRWWAKLVEPYREGAWLKQPPIAPGVQLWATARLGRDRFWDENNREIKGTPQFGLVELYWSRGGRK